MRVFCNRCNGTIELTLHELEAAYREGLSALGGVGRRLLTEDELAELDSDSFAAYCSVFGVEVPYGRLTEDVRGDAIERLNEREAIATPAPTKPAKPERPPRWR